MQMAALALALSTRVQRRMVLKDHRHQTKELFLFVVAYVMR